MTPNDIEILALKPAIIEKIGGLELFRENLKTSKDMLIHAKRETRTDASYRVIAAVRYDWLKEQPDISTEEKMFQNYFTILAAIELDN